MSGSRIIQASWLGTGALGVTAIMGAASPGVLAAPAFVVSVALFGVGCAVFVWAYALAVRRSRVDDIGVWGLYLLTGGVAPEPVRRRLLGSLGAQVVLGVAGAAARPFTSLASGVLAPVYGFALCGLWAARYGAFTPRSQDRTRVHSRGASVPKSVPPAPENADPSGPQ